MNGVKEHCLDASATPVLTAPHICISCCCCCCCNCVNLICSEDELLLPMCCWLAGCHLVLGNPWCISKQSSGSSWEYCPAGSPTKTIARFRSSSGSGVWFADLPPGEPLEAASALQSPAVVITPVLPLEAGQQAVTKPQAAQPLPKQLAATAAGAAWEADQVLLCSFTHIVFVCA